MANKNSNKTDISRRDFVTKTALAGAGLIITSLTGISALGNSPPDTVGKDRIKQKGGGYRFIATLPPRFHCLLRQTFSTFLQAGCQLLYFLA